MSPVFSLPWFRLARGFFRSLAALVLGIAGGGVVRAETAKVDPGYYRERWLVDDGLPHNVVNRIVQDGRGFLWVATAAGLARFDGRQFLDFPLPKLPENAPYNIRDLAVEDSSTIAMLPASGGILRLRDGVFSPHPASSLVGDKTLLTLFFEPEGVLWLGCENGEIMRWDRGEMTTFGPPQGLVRRAVGHSFFARDGDGRIWISSGDFLGWYRDGRLMRVPIETRTAIVIAPARSGGIWVSTAEQLMKWENDRLAVACPKAAWLATSASVQQIYEDNAGRVWIGTRRAGLFRLEDGKLVTEATEHFQIAAITGDREADVWVSMDGGGINRLRAKTFVALDSSAGLPDDISTSVCEDAAGVIWCADRAGGLVRVENGQKTRSFARTAEGAPLYASNVAADNAGNVWVGALNGLYRMPADLSRPMQRVTPEIQPVRVLYCSHAGDMWVGWGYQRDQGFQLGYFHEGVYRPLSPTEGFYGKHILAITEAADGVIWLGSDDGELFEFRDGKFSQHLAGEQIGRIHALHFDRQGGLWIGTERGLGLWEQNRWRRFTRADGLPDDLITKMLEDDDGRLWLCGRGGFFSVATDELRDVAAGRSRRLVARTFGKDEGLPGISSPTGGQPMSWKAHDGRLWFVTNRGVIGFDPKASRAPRSPPAIYMEETLVDGQPLRSGSVLRVRSGSERIEFHFVALNYSAPAKVRLRHRLVGFDQDWIETGSERSAAYVRLPPGKYTMRVIAGNQDGLWNEVGASLDLTVVPAWWQTWWWRVGVLLVFTGTVAVVARYFFLRRLKSRLERLEHEHALEKERARIARDLHDELGGSLTQIGMLADRLNRQASSPEVKQSLGGLAARTRGLAGELESIVWTISPKNDAWDRLAAFIAQFAQRFFHETAIACSVEGAETIPALALAPDAQHHVLSVVKEAMNNVLKHSRATVVKLTMGFGSGWFELRLRDDGIGFDPAAREHAERNGLANMRSRMAEIGGTFEIVSGSSGTEVKIRLPQTAGTAAAHD